jgi:hypothetical protein
MKVCSKECVRGCEINNNQVSIQKEHKNKKKNYKIITPYINGTSNILVISSLIQIC